MAQENTMIDSEESSLRKSSADPAALLLQVFGPALALAAVVWGLAMAYWVAFPGPSGEWARLGVFLAYVVNLPTGTICLIVGLAVKRGNARLSLYCRVAAIFALCLPLVAHGIDQYRTRWKYGIVSAANHRIACGDEFPGPRLPAKFAPY